MSGDAWEKFARENPYWAVLTHDRFKGQLDPSSKADFFNSGEGYVVHVQGMLDRHFKRKIRRRDTAIDFGCGVGRLTIPMAKNCRHVIGIDVSRSMREECLSNARAMHMRNIECCESPDRLVREGMTFDWISSQFVFQHIETGHGYRILEQLLGMVNVNGVVSLQFTLFKDMRHIRYVGDNLRYFSFNEDGVTGYHFGPGADGRNEMMMNDYRLDRIVQILYANGFGRYVIDMEDQDGMHGAMLYSIKDH